MLGVNTIQITPQILTLISELDEFKGVWTAMDKHTTALNMLREVAGHGASLNRVLKPLRERTITEDIVRILHATFTEDKKPQSYKDAENQIQIMQDGELIGTLDAALPEQVGPLMGKLVPWIDEVLGNKELHPLLAIAVFTAVFLQVSPFKDHNDRVARFLILLFMMKAGYAYAPYVPLDKIMNERAGLLFRALKHNQSSLETGRPDWGQWLLYFLNVLKDQKDILEQKIDDKDKDLSYLPTLSARILKLFDEHERLQMKKIIKLTNGRRSTIKLRIGELIDGGYLKRHGQARSTWYSLV